MEENQDKYKLTIKDHRKDLGIATTTLENLKMQELNT